MKSPYLGLFYWLAGSLLLAVLSKAQTNTFPTSGNVGIGTTSPGYPLTLWGGGIIGYNAVTADAKVSFGKIPLLQLTGDGTTNNGPSIALLQLNIAGVQPVQAAAELSLAATRGTTASTRVAVQNGDLLGGISWFGDDGTSMRTRGALVQASVDTTVVPVSTQVMPARLSIGTVAAAPIVFYTNAGSGTAGQFWGGSWQLSGAPNERMRIDGSGNVGIGTTNPTQKLAVNGTIRAKEVIVDTGWSDYVFASDYKLAPLSEVETHIKENGHLPGIPSAKEVAEHGVSMGEMQSKLLAKIEELTLHQIEQEKRIERLEAENRALRVH